MKRTYDCWLSRDEHGQLFLGQYKPNDDCGYWVNMGENMRLADHNFPELTYEKSPVRVTMTIEDAVERIKLMVRVSKPFSAVIGDLPCVRGCCKVNGTFVYIVDIDGVTTLAREGDVIAQKENGDWCVLSKFNEE